jgi:hypothetical protein
MRCGEVAVKSWNDPRFVSCVKREFAIGLPWSGCRVLDQDLESCSHGVGLSSLYSLR